MPLSQNRNYFVSVPNVHLRGSAGGGKKVNHLLMGDWLAYRGETRNGWAKVRCRGKDGWLKVTDFSEKRALEVNFVDVGQGDGCHIVTPDDDIILIDAGVGTNMNRFLSWRYNLRDRNVNRAPDFDPDDPDVKEPWKIDYVVVSHPDNDHYYGLLDVFRNPKLSFAEVYHNGIVERPAESEDPTLYYPSKDDLGGYVKSGSKRYLWNVIGTSTKIKELIKAHPKTTKQYLSTLRACVANTPGVRFKALSKEIDDLGQTVYMGPFDGTGDIELRVVGPIAEKITHGGETRTCLRKLGKESITKNGHSIVLQLRYGNLKIMLGGDLNTQSQDFLLQNYTSVRTESSKLEKKVDKLETRESALSRNDRKALDKARGQINDIVAEARAVFECDITKACHHGSAHFSDTFLKAVNASATVISSGDNESHSHPRPDALGAFGKYGNGKRPLIFSTELARSSKEFTPIIDYFGVLTDYLRRLGEAETEKDRRRIERDMEKHQDRNVAVYGMITLRALDDRVVIAQKLEVPRPNGTKWDIYELAYSRDTQKFESHTH